MQNYASAIGSQEKVQLKVQGVNIISAARVH